MKKHIVNIIIKAECIYMKQQYNPRFYSIIINPLYIIRKTLLKSIKRNATNITGIVLDFGCGSSPYRNLFNYKKYIRVDFINEGHPNQNNEIDVFYDGKKLPFDSMYFDSIICTEVLEHVPNTKEIMRELYRVLKPGGRAIFTIPFVWNEHEIPYDFYRFTQFGIAKKLEEAGFIIVENKKTTCTVHTITQLVSNAMHLTLFTRNLYINIIINFLFIFPVNFIGLLMGYIIPDRKKRLPLNIIILAQK